MNLTKTTAVLAIILMAAPFALPLPVSNASTTVPLFGDASTVNGDIWYYGTATYDEGTYSDIEGTIVFNKISVGGELQCRIYDQNGKDVIEPKYFVPSASTFGIDAALKPSTYTVMLASSNGTVLVWLIEIMSEFTITFDADLNQTDTSGYLYSPIKVLPGTPMGEQTPPYGKLPSLLQHPATVSGGIVTAYAHDAGKLWYELTDPLDPESDRILWNDDTVPTKDVTLYGGWTASKQYQEQYSATFTLS